MISSVSVIIPAYNCARYLGETIESILAQDATDKLEIIVVNDGSTDDTGRVARRFGNAVKLIDQANAGVCAARNCGLREAEGDFIAFVDHDDVWLPNKLASQLDAFEKHPHVDVVFTDFVWWHPDQPDGSFKQASHFQVSAQPSAIDGDLSGWIYHQMLLDSWVLTSTALARAHVVARSGGFDETLPFSEDWDFWLRISRESQFLKLAAKSTLYRQHPTQGSRVIRPIDYRTRLLEEAANKWGLCSPDGRSITPEQFKRQLAKYSTSFGLGHLKNGPGASRLLAAKAFVKAWSIDPRYWRPLAYLAATGLGWTPRW